MHLSLEKNIRDKQVLRESFIALAHKTFDLSFAPWYQGGYWTKNYIPYAMVDQGKIVANASVNIINTIWNKQPKRYVQIGTVMTDTAYRNQGLSRYILEEILNDWQNACDTIYLFANDAVLDFYPKFGFLPVIEHQYQMPIVPKIGKVEKLNMTTATDRALLKKYYAKSNPFSALPMLDNYGLLMFYCVDFMKDCVFYCEAHDAVVVAAKNGETLRCLDIYCDTDKSLHGILSTVATAHTTNIVFGFTPKDTSGCTATVIDVEDETLFIRKNMDNIFAQNKVMFPQLSHA